MYKVFLRNYYFTIVRKELGCDFSNIVQRLDFGIIFCEVREPGEYVKNSFNHSFIEILRFNVGH